MKDYKFTNEELKKCIECCIKAQTLRDCIEMKCPASTKQGCQFYLRTDDDRENIIYVELLKDALNFINRQESEAEKFFEEMDELLHQNATMQIATSTLHCKLAELKKKYTESEGKG